MSCEAVDRLARLLQRLRQEHAAAIVDLDDLADGDPAVCDVLRSATPAPLVVLSADQRREALLAGLRAGADEWLGLPPDGELVAARIQVHLRRGAGAPAHEILRAGPLTIDLGRRQAFRDGQPLALTPTEFKLLAVLARHAGRTLSPEQIILETHGPDYVHAGAAELVKAHVSNLRRKIECDATRPSVIVSVRGYGYMLERRNCD